MNLEGDAVTARERLSVLAVGALIASFVLAACGSSSTHGHSGKTLAEPSGVQSSASAESKLGACLPPATLQPSLAGRTVLLRDQQGQALDADNGVAVSRNGNFVAIGSQNSQGVYLWSRQDGQIVELNTEAYGGPGSLGDYSVLAASDDGTRVAFPSDGMNLPGPQTYESNMYIWSVKNDSLTRVTVTPSGGPADGETNVTNLAAFAADGRYLAYDSSARNLSDGQANSEENVYLWDAKSRRNTLVSHGVGGQVANSPAGDPSVDPSGKIVYFVSGATNLISGPVIRPDKDDLSIFSWSRVTGRIQKLVTPLRGSNIFLNGTSSNGRYLYYTTFSGDVQRPTVVSAYDAQTATVVSLNCPDQQQTNGCVAYRPDGFGICSTPNASGATADGVPLASIIEWNLTTGKAVQVATLAHKVGMSTDGRVILYVDQQSQLHVWEHP